MPTANGFQTHSGHTTTKDIYSRHGMPRLHVRSSDLNAAATVRQQACTSHGPLQRSPGGVTRQAASGRAAAAPQQQQAVAQPGAATATEPDLPLLPLQQQQRPQPQVQQAWQQDQQQQQQFLQAQPGFDPSTTYHSSSNSSTNSSSNSSDSPDQKASAVIAAVAGALQSSSSRSSSSSSSGYSQEELLATGRPSNITWSISHASSIDELAAVVLLHAPVLNCIHISAAFIQLQRLWPHAGAAPASHNSSSSSEGDSSRTSTAAASNADDDWLSSSIPSSSSSSSAELAAGRRLLPLLQSLALTVTRIDTRFVANVLYSLAALQSYGERGAYNAALVNKLCAAAYSLSNSMPPQELATLVWALARLSVVPAPALLRRLASNILRQLQGFGPQDLLMTLTGLPALHQNPGMVAPYATVHKLAAAAGNVMPAASAHEAASILAALGALQWYALPGWLQAYWDAVQPKVREMGWEQLAMVGWGLGQLSPLSAGPTASWLDAWQEALTQQLLLSTDAAAESSSSSSSSGPVPVVELVMVLYGWSKALPQQPPSQQLQQLVFSTTHAAMSSNSSSSSSSMSLKQQQQALQQQLQLPAGWQQQQHRAGQQQLVPQLQLQQQLPQRSLSNNNSSSSSSSSSSTQGLSPRLLSELVSSMARWQLLPPRQWLLSLLSNTQQQLLQGSYTAQDLSNTLWGLATLGVRPKTPWLDMAAAAATQQMQTQAAAVLQLQRQQQAWQHQRQQERQLTGQQQQRGGQQQQQPLLLQQQLDRARPQQQQQQQSSSATERLGRSSKQQLQQFANVPKQLAVLLWSFNQLQYRPDDSFWQQFWSASAPLLRRQCRVQDLSMTLEALVQQQQRPPQPWLTAALKAGGSVHMRERQLPGGPQQQQQQGRGSSSSSSNSSQPPLQQQQQEEGADQVYWSRLQSRQQQQFCRHVVRMLSGFARLGVQPGHAWCAAVLNKALQPVVGHLAAQDMAQMLWALGGLGYQPAGRALPYWLHTHLLHLMFTPPSPHSSSSTNSSSSAASAGCCLSSMPQDSAVMLLVGLRRCRVVLPGPQLMLLLRETEAHAADLTPQVLLHLLAYVASTAVRPPTSWTAAVVAALPSLIQSHSQLTADAAQPPGTSSQQQQQQQVWLLVLLSSLYKLRVLLQPELLTQLQQAVAQVTPQVSPDVSKGMQHFLAALQTGFNKSAAQQQQVGAGQWGSAGSSGSSQQQQHVSAAEQQHASDIDNTHSSSGGSGGGGTNGRWSDVGYGSSGSSGSNGAFRVAESVTSASSG